MSTLTASEKKPEETEGLDKLEHFEVCDPDGVDRNNSPPSEEAWRATEKRLVRKLDMTLMPMVWIVYLFNYLDRNNIACVNQRTHNLDNNSDLLSLVKPSWTPSKQTWVFKGPSSIPPSLFSTSGQFKNSKTRFSAGPKVD